MSSEGVVVGEGGVKMRQYKTKEHFLRGPATRRDDITDHNEKKIWYLLEF